MKVRVIRENCISLGNCVAIAPTVFLLDEEGKSTVLDPTSVSEDVLWQAAMACSVDAIVLEDDSGTQLYP